MFSSPNIKFWSSHIKGRLGNNYLISIVLTISKIIQVVKIIVICIYIGSKFITKINLFYP